MVELPDLVFCTRTVVNPFTAHFLSRLELVPYV